MGIFQDSAGDGLWYTIPARSGDKTMVCIAIRREDKSRWERRTPLTPIHVQQLTGQGIEVDRKSVV